MSNEVVAVQVRVENGVRKTKGASDGTQQKNDYERVYRNHY